MFTACPQPGQVTDEAKSGPLITSLQVTPGELSPTFDRDVRAFTLSIDATFVELEVTTVEGATVTVNGAPGAKQSLFLPVGDREFVVVAERGAERDERRLTVSRATWYGTERLAPAEVPTFQDPDPGNGARGFGKPTLADDGRFLATSFGEEHNRWAYLDVYRIDRPTPVRVVHLERFGLTPLVFCHLEDCLWLRDDLPDGSGANSRQKLIKLTWKDSRVELQTWQAASPDLSMRVLDPDAMEIVEYDGLAQEAAATRTLLPNGALGPRVVLPELSWGGAAGGHAVSADLTWLLHEELRGGSVLAAGQHPVGEVMVFHREGRTGAWALTQRLASPDQQEESQFGRRMKLSADATHLFAGLPFATVQGEAQAGLVAVFERTATGFVPRQVLTAPQPKAGDGFGGVLLGEAPSRVLTLSGAPPWSSWLLDPSSVTPGPLLPPQFNRIANDLSVAVSISVNEQTGLREWKLWR